MAGVVRVLTRLPTTDLREWDQHQRQLNFKGEFTARLLGCTTEPTATARYYVSGGIVALKLPSLSATSNSALAFIGGLPGAITPAFDSTSYIPIIDNGVISMGSVRVGSDTGMTLSTDLADPAGANFTASGTKGFRGCTVVYGLD